ncbi:MAG: LysM peptidoglycan-binding domain-containing protein [Bacteroidota bacterium]
MITRLLQSFMIVGLISISTQVYANNTDSLRLEYIDGQAYIIHQVDPGETLFSIARRYNASMNEIAEASPEVKKGLHEGMIIKVPYDPDAKPRQAPPQPKEIIHTVAQGETLYSISRIYEVSVIDIMEWNDLLSTTLDIGQKLKIEGKPVPEKTDFVRNGQRYHVVQAGEGLYAVARIYNIPVDSLVAWNRLESSALNLGQELMVGSAGGGRPSVISPKPMPKVEPREQVVEVDEQVQEEAVVVSEEPAPTPEVSQLPERGESVKKRESGMAASIVGESGGETYLAMHRNLPVGTLVAVRNEMNNQVVFVRIVGKLPDTGINEKIIIRLSGSAVKQLRAIDPKFRVEISFMEPVSGF